MRRWTIALLLTVAALSMSGSAARACPMCKDSIATSGDAAQAGSLPSGFNTSVYLMLLGFFGALGLVSTVIVKGVCGTDNFLPPPPRRRRDDEARDSERSDESKNGDGKK